MSKKSKSHPAIRFKHLPVVEGPLIDFERSRKKILTDVSVKTLEDFEGASVDLLLGEALYLERARLKRVKRTNVFTLPRVFRDVRVWRKVKRQLRRPPVETDRKDLLRSVLGHYGEEVGGHFDPRVYELATHLVPWLASWILNAASVRNFLPWKMTESLESRMTILGEIPHLQKLAQKGTILLVPTHQSNVDSLIIGYVIYLMSLPPFAYGAGLNLFSNPFLSFFMSGLGAYTVDRQKTSQVYKRYLKNYSTRILQEGVHSIFFPGGGRSRSGAIESKLKLGLLGTGLEAQLLNLREGKPNPNIYVVPMVMSYDFVLEGSSLIEQHLSMQGKHLFLGADTEPPLPIIKLIRFLWKFFSSNSGLTCRIGKPLDVFGNLVDEEGQSIGPNQTTIDPKRWLSTQGELQNQPQRDMEYTRMLGQRLTDSYYRENTVISTHLVAFSFFMILRKKYKDLDLYRFLRLSKEQRSLPYEQFLEEAEKFHQIVTDAAKRGELHMSELLKTKDTRYWVEYGIKHLGTYHDADVIKVKDGVVWTEDMNLLYFYRNRLSGYGFSLFGERGRAKRLRGENDEKGFLA